MEHYDAIILGAGIAGASVAHALALRGQRVLVLDKNSICSADSYAAGAFLSPKMSKPSAYKTYLNDAFSYALSYYKKYFPTLLAQSGLLKLPLDEADKIRLKSYEPTMTVEWEKRGEEYFFPEAGLIEPTALIEAMLKDVDVRENYHYDAISYHDNWQIDDYCATNLIIATGSADLPFELPYIERKKVAGYRYDVHFDAMQTHTHNIHRELSFSHYHDNKVIIGATHIRGDGDIEEAAYHDSDGLLKKAATIRKLDNLKVVKSYTGYRTSVRDYFPIVGEVIHHDKTLETYPYIQKGSKVPSEKFIPYPHLYIHTALASRGFVFAPYNALMLVNLILEGRAIDERLSPIRLFRKWARKGADNQH